ncbi:MAG TPA: hypothetical protein VIU65_09355 [Pyrinomonadaceae bacterium]
MKQLIRFTVITLILLAAPGFAMAQTPAPKPTPAATPPPSDIYLTFLTRDFKVGAPAKFTQYVGYNNQPAFLADDRSLLYTSIRNGQADIYQYDPGFGGTTQVTNTPESEYSPTLMPDGKNISVVRVEADGTQRLWKFPLTGGGPPSLILEKIKPVGYHWWLDKNTLALFILGGTGKPATLQIADVRTEKTEVVTENPGRILRLVPRQHKLSFVHKVSDKEWLIKTFDLKTKEISTLIKTLPGSEDYAWTPDGALLMAKEAKLFKWEPSKDKDWAEIADFSNVGLKTVTRIAISPKGDRIAFVAR